MWKVRNEQIDGGYAGGKKLRPRDEWVINENTHEALISGDEAQKILNNLENSSHSQGRRTPATYLLSGMLKTPEGESWFGDAGTRYRTKGERNYYIKASNIHAAVLDQIFTDLYSTNFIQLLISDAKSTTNRRLMTLQPTSANKLTKRPKELAS